MQLLGNLFILIIASGMLNPIYSTGMLVFVYKFKAFVPYMITLPCRKINNCKVNIINCIYMHKSILTMLCIISCDYRFKY